MKPGLMQKDKIFSYTRHQIGDVAKVRTKFLIRKYFGESIYCKAAIRGSNIIQVKVCAF